MKNGRLVALPLARVPRIYFDYLIRNASPARPKTAARIIQEISSSAFYSGLIDRTTVRSFITNFHRIVTGLEIAFNNGILESPGRQIAQAKSYAGKERVYCIAGKWQLVHQGVKT